MKLALAACAALAVGAAVTATGYAVDGGNDAAPPEALGPGPVTVLVDVEHSRFEPSKLRVVAGTEVRFVLVNDDPINHELIIGPPDVHARHADGTEASHAPKDGELSVGPDGQGVTSYVFDEIGTVEMACHLPGHYEYGMHGAIEVVGASASASPHTAHH